LSFTGVGVYAISDTTPVSPLPLGEGFDVPSGGTATLNTTSHVWAMAAGNAGVSVYVAPVTAASVSGGGPVTGAVGSFLDGWDQTKGAKVDAAWDLVSANPSMIALLKKNDLQMAGAIPQQSTDGVIIGATQPVASTLGGATPYNLIAASGANSTLIGAAGAHTVYGVQLANIAAAPAYLKLYDKATAPTCGSDIPKAVFIIPAAATAALGGGSNVAIPVGKAFALGLGICIVTGIDNSNSTGVAASNVVINIDYK
jgi:hypothetical protein